MNTLPDDISIDSFLDIEEEEALVYRRKNWRKVENLVRGDCIDLEDYIIQDEKNSLWTFELAIVIAVTCDLDSNTVSLLLGGDEIFIFPLGHKVDFYRNCNE